MAALRNDGAAAPGPVTPGSDEAPAGGTAQGFRNQDSEHADCASPGAFGGLFFLEVAHDEGCPGRYEDGRGCTCAPTLTLHADGQRFIRGELHNRAARRKAAREAEKALRRARGGRA